MVNTCYAGRSNATLIIAHTNVALGFSNTSKLSNGSSHNEASPGFPPPFFFFSQKKRGRLRSKVGKRVLLGNDSCNVISSVKGQKERETFSEKYDANV